MSSVDVWSIFFVAQLNQLGEHFAKTLRKAMRERVPPLQNFQKGHLLSGLFSLEGVALAFSCFLHTVGFRTQTIHYFACLLFVADCL